MWQYIAVFIILMLSVLYVIMKFRRSLKEKSTAGGSPLCAGCSGCALYEMRKCRGKVEQNECRTKKKVEKVEKKE